MLRNNYFIHYKYDPRCSNPNILYYYHITIFFCIFYFIILFCEDNFENTRIQFYASQPMDSNFKQRVLDGMSWDAQLLRLQGDGGADSSTSIDHSTSNADINQLIVEHRNSFKNSMIPCMIAHNKKWCKGKMRTHLRVKED
jgi:hypothetical protein